MGAKSRQKKERERMLARYKLPQQVLQAYGLEVEEIQCVGRVWKLTTNKGVKALKMVRYDEARVIFIFSLLEHLARKGFSRIPRLIRTQYHTPFIRREDEYYLLSDWIEGRECNFADRGDLQLAAEELARFHLCSEGLELPGDLEAPNNWGIWPAKFEERSAHLLQFRNLAEKTGKREGFYRVFIDHFPSFAGQARRAIELLRGSDYLRLVEEAKGRKTLCHRNYFPENLIIDQEERLYLLNFDYALQDLRIYDLASFLQKALIPRRWEFDLAKDILGAYERVYPLEQAEWEVLLAVLHFPHEAWLWSGRFFRGQPGVSEKHLVRRLKNIISAYKAKENFLAQLAELVKSGKEELSYGG